MLTYSVSFAEEWSITGGVEDAGPFIGIGAD
jgi:hypothetical protein